jgi:hypothetical protein
METKHDLINIGCLLASLIAQPIGEPKGTYICIIAVSIAVINSVYAIYKLRRDE